MSQRMVLSKKTWISSLLDFNNYFVPLSVQDSEFHWTFFSTFLTTAFHLSSPLASWTCTLASPLHCFAIGQVLIGSPGHFHSLHINVPTLHTTRQMCRFNVQSKTSEVLSRSYFSLNVSFFRLLVGMVEVI